jgi:predicted membrane channel-forming protein YqfA (hemolysin III family)
VTEPSWRKPVGIAAIMLLILFWAALVASLSVTVGRWPVLVQAVFYLVMGVAWIVPLKPLLRWAETGRWRKPADGAD